MFGKKSEMGSPLWPPGSNFRTEGVNNPTARPPELMNCLSCGKGCPAYFSKAGFGSKVSTWLGPPFISKKITLFTLVGK
jgi:hypothetical protein